MTQPAEGRTAFFMQVPLPSTIRQTRIDKTIREDIVKPPTLSKLVKSCSFAIYESR